MADGSDDIQALVGLMARLPGLGPRSARRIVLHLPTACPWLPEWHRIARAVGATT